jgi:hypothetical protein
MRRASISINEQSSGMSSAVASCRAKLQRQAAMHLESSEVSGVGYYYRVYSTLESTVLVSRVLYSSVESTLRVSSLLFQCHTRESTHSYHLSSLVHTLAPHTR